ncbi:MAG: transaldolase [Pseudomonadales bacterium]|jgi:transaldolase|nr:transaldolase [Pseudomonadales bacterium]MCP5336932.1 transaldolase [Pseudomonadales bacterium]
MNQLEQLRTMTTVVADTGDIESIAAFRPTDATTNPSLLLKAAQKADYAHLLDDALAWGNRYSGEQRDAAIMDRLAVNFGTEILKLVPGRVSTEVDARLSFDTDATIRRAEGLIDLYEQLGITRERVLIKIASTWEGIQAAATLERRGIRCNMTLLFGFAQAVACADAGVRLISPFVGRILDWYKKHEGRDAYPADEDPGVLSVRRIYSYYKHYGYATEIMGASFRNLDQIRALAGCDLLTIAPALMNGLEASEAALARTLDPQGKGATAPDKLVLDEHDFRWELNEDAMATEKLAEGIRIFGADIRTLQTFVHNRGKA